MPDQITITKEDIKPVADFCKNNLFLFLTWVIVDAAIGGLYAITKKEVSK